MIDPVEIRAFEAATTRLSHARAEHDEALDLYLQASQRFLRLLEVEGLVRPPAPFAPPPVPPAAAPKPPAAPLGGYLGDACPQCGLLRLRFKGTCKACDACGWDTGCG